MQRHFIHAGRVLETLWGDVLSAQPRLFVVNVLVAILPARTLGFDVVTSRLRPLLYRAAGARIGHQTQIHGRVEFSGGGRVPTNVCIGERCMLTTPLFINANAPVTIGDRVTIGHHVIIMTDTHMMSDPLHRCGELVSLPTIIEDGAWICAGATILPGVRIGRGSVVAAGAVVTSDVPPHTLVGGVPARTLKVLASD